MADMNICASGCTKAISSSGRSKTVQPVHARAQCVRHAYPFAAGVPFAASGTGLCSIAYILALYLVCRAGWPGATMHAACAHQPGVGPSADWSPEHRPQPHSISDIEDGGSLPCLPGRPGFIGRFDLQCRGCPACQSARLTNCLTVAVVKWVHGAMHA